MNTEFWKGKRVLVTGHTGFKGAWLSQVLSMAGAEVVGVGLPPSCRDAIYNDELIKNIFYNKECGINEFVDILNVEELSNAFDVARPEIVFHLAAQAFVVEGYNFPKHTFATNFSGTLEVLELVSAHSCVKAAVVVTTDKVYKTSSLATPFDETDALGGRDPYSASKAAADILASCYQEALLKDRNVGLGIARAGNVLGGGDWGQDRLLPDYIKAHIEKRVLEVRYPNAVRPWQHILDPLSGYITLAERLYDDPVEFSRAYNFGPSEANEMTVTSILNLCQTFFTVQVRPTTNKSMHETSTLSLRSQLAKDMLGHVAKYDVLEAVELTLNWYRRYLSGERPSELCKEQAAQYFFMAS